MRAVGSNKQDSIKDLARQRLLAALEHKMADRVPLTLGSPSCSIHQLAHGRLLEYLDYTPEDPPAITDNILQIVETDQRLLDFFDIDMHWLLPKAAPVRWSTDQSEFTDDFGRTFVAGGGFFNQTGFPLQSCSKEEIQKYKFPPLSKILFTHLGNSAKELYGKGYGLGIDGPWGLYEISSSLIGTSEYLMMFILNPGQAREIAERVLEMHLIPFYDMLLSETAQYVHVVGMSDDLGSQTGLLFSPQQYRDLFKPLHKRLIEHIHSLTDAKVFMHSDGSIYPIIPDLIEIGVEGLNPVQYTARDMDLERLVREFGKDLGFFGGVVENEVLSFGTPEEIREIVRQNVSILKKSAAHIYAPIHNISQEVPPENIIAFYQVGIEFGMY